MKSFIVLILLVVLFALSKHVDTQSVESRVFHLPIYDPYRGSLLNHIESFSWAKINEKDTTFVQKPFNYSLSAIMKNWEALYLAGDQGYAPPYIQEFRCTIHGGASPGVQVAVVMLQNQKPVGKKIDISDKVKANEWVDISIPFSSFEIPDQKEHINSIWFQASSATESGTIYLSNITLIVQTKWSMTWHDEFDKLDLNTWNLLNGTHGPSSNEKEHYLPENVYVKDGKMVLETKAQKYGIYNYTSGWADTQHKFGQAFGRWEIYGKIPSTHAIWPAYWLMPNVPICWPKGGEIDILEAVNTMHAVHAAFHWENETYPCYTHDESTGAFWYTNDVAPSDDYHLYALEWDEETLNYFFDDVRYWVVKANGTVPGQWSHPTPQEPFYIILNTALGGSWPGDPNKNTVLPQYNYIDWVRVYKAAS